MKTLEEVKRAKELAGRKAFEKFAEVLQEELGEEGLVEALDGTAYAHTAFLMLSKPVHVSCRWDFSAHPAVIVAEVNRLKAELAKAEAAASKD